MDMVVMAPRQHWLHSWQIIIDFIRHAKNENFIGWKLLGLDLWDLTKHHILMCLDLDILSFRICYVHRCHPLRRLIICAAHSYS
jgi:hypothetical protein